MNNSPVAENSNRICHLIPFEEGSNTSAEETVQLLLWLSDPSGRTMYTARMLLYHFERKKENCEYNLRDTLQSIHSPIIATVSLGLL